MRGGRRMVPLYVSLSSPCVSLDLLRECTVPAVLQGQKMHFIIRNWAAAHAVHYFYGSTDTAFSIPISMDQLGFGCCF